MTTHKPRKFFSFEIDPQTRERLASLTKFHSVPASGIIRMLINREYVAINNGNGSKPDNQNPVKEEGKS